MATITVKKKLFSTITGAIIKAKPGDTIVLEPGEYNETLIIRKPITIVGNGEVTIKGSIEISSDVTFKNINFKTKKFGKKIIYSIFVRKGTVKVIDCNFLENKGYGVYVNNEAYAEISNVTISEAKVAINVMDGATCFVQDSNIQNSSVNGIIYQKDAKGKVNRCIVEGTNKYPAIYIGENCEVTVQDSKIHSNNFRGIDTVNAKINIINCDFYENTDEQIFATDGSNVTVKNCNIHNGVENASAIYATKSTINIENCSIYSHEAAQIFAQSSSITVKNTKIFDGPNATAIRLVEESTAEVDDCEIFQNDLIQISIESGSEIFIQNCLVYSSKQPGIAFEKGTGTIENCKIYQNTNSQIHAVESSEVTVNHCHIYNSNPETSGFYVNSSSKLTLNDCDISGHDFPQIYGELGTIEINHSKIHDGNSNGIRIINAKAKINDCEFFEHDEYCQISVEDSSNLYLQNSTVHSNVGPGLSFESASGIVGNCKFFENGWRQIFLCSNSNARIMNTEIFKGKEETNAILVTEASQVEIENCKIKENDYPHLFIDEKSEFKLIKSEIMNGQKGGMRIIDAQGIIDACEFKNNGEYQHICIEEGSEVTVQNSQIYSGDGIGVLIENAKGIISQCELYDNDLSQIEITDNGYSEVNNCRIYDGRSHGIRVGRGATATIQDVSIFGHKGEWAQVVIKQGANPTFQRCKIYDGQYDGVYIFEEGLGIFEDCFISNHRYANFCIVTGSKPILRRNQIFNGKYGVFSEQYANPTIEKCTFENNSQDVYFDESCKPVLNDNEFNSVSPYQESANEQSQIEQYEKVLGFNPNEMGVEELKQKLILERKKWINRLNAPSLEKRQKAERALSLIEQIEKEIDTK